MSYIPGSLLNRPTTKALLQEGLARINDQENWVKECFHVQKGDQTCYCAIGAIRAPYLTRGITFDEYYDCIAALVNALPKKKGWGTELNRENVYAFNDHPQTTHKQIVNLYKRAIKNVSGT